MQFGRHLLNAKRQYIDWHRIIDEAFNGLKLTDKLDRRVDAYNALRAGTEHSPTVVSIATANIQHQAIVQWLDVRQQPVPFHVRAPFGIDLAAKQLKGSLAPRVQSHEHLAKLLGGDRQLLAAADANRCSQLSPICGNFR
jgi:hypothetical protein